ncbi:hypothetical protein DAPPUDRAFT_263502 [Daphnia pulex]|uniref:Uncharacterized protein n=1 Tax=Daphnia pulex TaxID=6669 RepID=E9HPV6_DAPPU|nr:hypothetical protein DAPPUDRAFT_263502 [Daphnia pulex]|eukprot:EFX66234.1 hypothetical protein DAPPUDRAFT_263502 [Daphnia pulex]
MSLAHDIWHEALRRQSGCCATLRNVSARSAPVLRRSVEFAADGSTANASSFCEQRRTRSSKLAEFQHVSSSATLQRCVILQLAWAIDMEGFCHPDSATFAKHLRDVIDTACATPIMMSSERSVAVDQSPPCSDTDTEEEREDNFEVSQVPLFRSLSISSDGKSGGVSSVSGSPDPHRMENEFFSGRKRPETCPAVDELRGSTVESPAVEGERQPAKMRRLSSTSSSSPFGIPPPSSSSFGRPPPQYAAPPSSGVPFERDKDITLPDKKFLTYFLSRYEMFSSVQTLGNIT